MSITIRKGSHRMEKMFEGELAHEMTERGLPTSIPLFLEFVRRHTWETGYNEAQIQEIGLAVQEALQNIVTFACLDGAGNISISCTTQDSGALVITMVDTGVPFNMLLAGTFSETADFFEPGKIPSTSMMKKAIKNIEYRRGSDRNTLVFTIAPDQKTKK
jgi:anti-sigma regulatory factor (Ser/Thr protein kinase)